MLREPTIKRARVDEDYMRRMIRSDIESTGHTQESWAKAKGFSAQFICDVLAGRRGVTESLAKAMGYERKIIFERSV